MSMNVTDSLRPEYVYARELCKSLHSENLLFILRGHDWDIDGSVNFGLQKIEKKLQIMFLK